MHITRWKSDMLCDSNHVAFRDHVESRGGGGGVEGGTDGAPKMFRAVTLCCLMPYVTVGTGHHTFVQTLKRHGEP